MNATGQDPAFEALLEYLHSSRGFDFTGYKRASLMRRVRKRMGAVGLEDFGDYQDYLEVHPEEYVQLFNTILINVTAFFRDWSAWDYLAREIIPRLLADKPAHAPLRIWSAGCASGEEAYTLALPLVEALGPEAFRQRAKIYATDVDEAALAQARQASYSAKELGAVPAALRDKYFELVEDRYVFRNDLRRSIIFGRHDLVQDAPISQLDLLVCRNTLIYFNSETQARILARFHFALNDNGSLFLGKSERLLTYSNLFRPVNSEHRIFAKVPTVSQRSRLLALTGDEEASHRLTQHMHLREVSFDSAPLAQAVVDLAGNLVLANAQVCALFGLSPRDLGRSFHELELSYRPVELRSPMERAYAERRPITLTEVEYHSPGREVQYLDVKIVPLQDNGGNLLGVCLTFADVTRYHRLQKELERSNQELETAYEELQSTNEELETTNEELQSTNEELETTNEELQSTNEELETMNEELQSTNEQLKTMNEELRQRTDELNNANAFLNSILVSLHAGVVVVDHRPNVLIWNHGAEDLWGLRADEVQGRPFLNLNIGLPVEHLKEPIRNCLAGEVEGQTVTLEAVNRRGKAIQCRVDCTPLTDQEGVHQGVILLMEEV